MPAHRIRQADPADLPQMNQVAFKSKAHWAYTARQLEAWREDLTTQADTLASHPTFVAEMSGTVVGFVQLNPRAAPWRLESLWVLPECMGRGLGKALLAQALDIARAAGQTDIAIDADPNALGFYLSRGARRLADVAAPIDGQPQRVRPQLLLATLPPA
ncbi:GNAT family N-acetyltransferase [Chromobacterium vaccinii]|uniref:GNAT family N-acetyltransferase n=1 Tax=Chromobacterium vaccinii TaxID=1108595 RepID=UPI000CE98975|nr:GNAT family N-acetyltransferase [Chromobacterium vaccinii]AVG16712.1 GNAT family N-acetyltransferase [Chromobacterium vaccinii]